MKIKTKYSVGDRVCEIKDDPDQQKQVFGIGIDVYKRATLVTYFLKTSTDCSEYHEYEIQPLGEPKQMKVSTTYNVGDWVCTKDEPHVRKQVRRITIDIYEHCTLETYFLQKSHCFSVHPENEIQPFRYN